jgi:Fe-S cluster assembly protein SufD
MSATEHTGRYVSSFKAWQETSKGAGPAWLKALRQAGISSFASLGFPTTKNEEWKYTNVEPVVSQAFELAVGESKQPPSAELLSKAFVEADAPRLVFFDGVFAPQLSSLQGLPQGVQLVNLGALLKSEQSGLAARVARHADYRRHAFVALNTAFINDGAAVMVSPGCRLSQPIYIVYMSGAGKRPLVSHPRTLILAGARSEVSIVESYAGVNGGAYFSNAVTELIGEPDAWVQHCRVQREGAAAFHTGTLAANVGRGCHLAAHAITLSGALVRNDVHVSLDGEGAECVLNGLYLGADKQHVDNFTEIEHVKPRATSLELYKGILDDASHGVFNGKIVVHKDAQKSDARQTNRNLLLSADAVVNTKPQLEIYADDVKCSHGSTIGQLDPDALFYLRSRGLGPDEARSLLSFAFASDIVARIKIKGLRRRLDDYLAAKFRDTH